MLSRVDNARQLGDILGHFFIILLLFTLTVMAIENNWADCDVAVIVSMSSSLRVGGLEIVIEDLAIV